MNKKIRRVTLLGNILVLLVAAVLYLSDTLQVLNYSIFDFNMKASMSGEPHEDIIVVTIDEASLREIGTFPWERNVYIPFIQYITKAGAKAVAFDVTFTTNSLNPENDRLLAEELAKHDHIIFPSYVELENVFSRTLQVNRGELLMGYGLETPIPILDRVVQRAHINALIDSDSAYRRTWLKLNTPEGVVPTMSLKAAQLAGVDTSRLEGMHPQTEVIIKYEAVPRDFLNISFQQVLKGEVPEAVFQDAIVLVGFAAAGMDIGRTPVDKSMYLVYAHANLLNQILNDIHVKPENERATLLLMLIMMGLTVFYSWRTKPVLSVSLVFISILVLFAGQYYLFAALHQVWNIIYAIAGLLIAFFVNIAIKTYFETKQKNFITKQFGRYLSPDLVKEIAKSDQELPLGGINKELSILFLDIRGFTTLSEKLHPEEVVDFLNTMFDLITTKALENQGTIDKFIGDAAMIIFNAPLDVANHEYYAVKTAHDIQEGMNGVREEIMEKHGVTINVGIGINSGNVVVGNIGSYLRVDYTAIGDNVNIAARIESNTTANQILVSEAVYEKTQANFEYAYIGERTVKGKSVPLKLFEVKKHLRAPGAESKGGAPSAAAAKETAAGEQDEGKS